MSGGLVVPQRLREFCESHPALNVWFEELPRMIASLARRWSLELDAPFDGTSSSCSWVAPAIRKGGQRVVLKLGAPHFEAEHEIAGLRFWTGSPTVHLLEADEALNAMLLERCEPGTSLNGAPAEERDHVIAELLVRLWRTPEDAHSFRPLSSMVDFWCAETRASRTRWLAQPEIAEYAETIEGGLRAFELLAVPAAGDVLLATDLHAGNVLRAQREPWLVIDPKPFVGDAAYDLTQHLFNRGIESHPDPVALIERLARLSGVDAERVCRWMFARAAAEPRDRWTPESLSLARRLGGGSSVA